MPLSITAIIILAIVAISKGLASVRKGIKEIETEALKNSKMKIEATDYTSGIWSHPNLEIDI